MSYATDHLSAGEREDIAKYCFEVTEKRGDELHGLCPFHAEKQPSFSYNAVKDVCNCFSCGAKGDLISLWGTANGYSDNSEAFKAFRDRYCPGDTSPPPKQEKKKPKAKAAKKDDDVTRIIPEEEWQRLPVLPDAWRRRCREKFSWSDAAMTALDLRLWVSSGGEERIAIPIRRDDGALVNVRLYRPGADENKVKSWARGFGKSKLFPAPAQWKKGPILLCEGEKDTITAISHGFNAVTQTAGCNSWDDKFLRFFEGREVVIAYDADEKGLQGARRVAGKLAGVASVRMLQWPDVMGMADDHGQDLTDYFASHGGTTQGLNDLIGSAVQVDKPSPRAAAIPENVKRFFGGGRGTQFKPRLVADEIISWRRLIHDPKAGVMYTWNDASWEEYDQANIRRQVLTMLGIEGTTPRVTDVLGIVRDLSIMPHGRALNDRTGIIPLQNGMFSVDTGSVIDHDPDNLNTYTLDISLDLQGDLPDCQAWKDFLLESVVDPETIRELQKFFGLCYTRETRYEKALFLIGPGGDGKGTILKILQSLLGEINISNVTLSGILDQFHRVMIRDKLLNVATEVDSSLLQSDIFKTIVSGEPVTAAYKHRDAFNFTPVCKLAFSANKHPTMQDTSEGLYRRLLLIEMDKKFVASGRADLYLYDKLIQEKAGIFLWGLRGLQLLRQEGFKASPFMDDCLDRFKLLNNPVLSFVQVHVAEDPQGWICNMEVYRKYAQFCSKRGYKALGESRFGIELRKCCPSARTKRATTGARRWGYEGISLVDDYGD